MCLQAARDREAAARATAAASAAAAALSHVRSSRSTSAKPIVTRHSAAARLHGKKPAEAHALASKDTPAEHEDSAHNAVKTARQAEEIKRALEELAAESKSRPCVPCYGGANCVAGCVDATATLRKKSAPAQPAKLARASAPAVAPNSKKAALQRRMASLKRRAVAAAARAKLREDSRARPTVSAEAAGLHGAEERTPSAA